MKLTDLASKPQLIKITLDDEEIVQEYGEPLDFWTWDRQPMETFLKVAQVGNQDYSVLLSAVKTMVLDEAGNEIITDGMALPSTVLIKVLNKVVETLGK